MKFGGILLLGFVIVAGFAFYAWHLSQNDQSEISVTSEKNLIDPIKEVGSLLPSSGFLVSDFQAPDHIDIDKLQQKSVFEALYNLDSKGPVSTNQWFSSLYFTEGSENFFAFPLAFHFSEKSFEISYPNIGVNEEVVFGSFTEDLRVEFAESVEAHVSQVGDFSVVVSIVGTTSGKQIADVYIMRGSPFVYVDVLGESSVQVVSEGYTFEDQDEFYQLDRSENARYGVFPSESVTAAGAVSDGGTRLSAIAFSAKDKDRGLFAIGIEPSGMQISDLGKFAGNPVIGTEVTFEELDGVYTTQYNVQTRTGEGTYMGLLPHHSALLVGNDQCTREVFYKTLRGSLTLCEGVSFETRLAKPSVPSTIDVSILSDVQKKELSRLIKEDVQSFEGFLPKDTYFLGKKLLRAAHLYEFAQQLSLDEEAEAMRLVLREEFDLWYRSSIDGGADAKYFVYDPKVRGIVGYEPSFGADRFNDHHFHYGYFVQAAAIIGRYDEEFVTQYGGLISALANDYMNVERGHADFPYLRTFDLYEGHSWAAGESRFGDGNNQESTSEAVQAYYGAHLWGKLIGSEGLEHTGLWLYAQEAESAHGYWLLTRDYSPVFDGYKPPAVSLLWGGKIEWGTWFSGEPEAKLGIQLIPFTAGSAYVDSSPEKIQEHLDATNFPEQKLFFDQLLMYYALADADKAMQLFQQYENAGGLTIDDGNTKSFVYAWIAYQQNLK